MRKDFLNVERERENSAHHGEVHSRKVEHEKKNIEKQKERERKRERDRERELMGGKGSMLFPLVWWAWRAIDSFLTRELGAPPEFQR